MGKHKTEISLNLFDFIIDIGQTLRYHTDTEYPMSEDIFGSQAIDIAWFNNEGNKFPLFIFEIESTSNNSIANNPTKVFGKDSKAFEKPLFFFHIIIDGAENSEKYGDLIGLFGKYNYDIFRINNGETEDLLVKIIAQHRRIHDYLNLYFIIRVINNYDDIKTEINFERFLKNVETLIHENEFYQLGQIYADIASLDKFFIEQYNNFIYRCYHDKSLSFLRYESYYAGITSEFINLGILHSKFGNELKEINFLDLLMEAQKTETFQKMEYLPGLNYDYDVFIEDYIPFYLALTFFLFDKNLDSQRYILNITIGILKKLESTNEFVYEHHASWGLLMASSNSEFSDEFEFIKNSINSKGGMLDTILFCPVFENDHHKFPHSKLVKIHSQNEYISIFKEEFKNVSNDMSIYEIAIMSLSENWKDEIDYHINLGVNLSCLAIKSIS